MPALWTDANFISRSGNDHGSRYGLDLGDAADGNLPDDLHVLRRRARTATKTKKMSWCPPWVGVLILGKGPLTRT